MNIYIYIYFKCHIYLGDARYPYLKQHGHVAINIGNHPITIPPADLTIVNFNLYMSLDFIPIQCCPLNDNFPPADLTIVYFYLNMSLDFTPIQCCPLNDNFPPADLTIVQFVLSYPHPTPFDPLQCCPFNVQLTDLNHHYTGKYLSNVYMYICLPTLSLTYLFTLDNYLLLCMKVKKSKYTCLQLMVVIYPFFHIDFKYKPYRI